ncbi:hypothetical protein OIU91_09925 [Streptomyces sp. NBC_01456]|uniref:hypothetical protein n=1 Tax=unclassified Streptomyces TaxID=2593676 RepID=UPI002E315594|nr:MULTISPECIES: hypothetical protein [unclassified Streptomyces]
MASLRAVSQLAGVRVRLGQEQRGDEAAQWAALEFGTLEQGLSRVQLLQEGGISSSTARPLGLAMSSAKSKRTVDTGERSVSAVNSPALAAQRRRGDGAAEQAGGGVQEVDGVGGGCSRRLLPP